MKNCRYCGAELDGAFFLCPECGKQLSEQSNRESYYDDVLPEDGGYQKKKSYNSKWIVYV